MSATFPKILMPARYRGRSQYPTLHSGSDGFASPTLASVFAPADADTGHHWVFYPQGESDGYFVSRDEIELVQHHA